MKIDGRKISRERLAEIRIEVVRRVEGGERPSDVARAMELGTNRVFEYLARYREGGAQALERRKAPGRPTRLRGTQLRWIYKTLTTKNPTQLEFAFALWTRGMIKTLIYRKFRVRTSLTSVCRMLAKLGLSCQKPLSKAYEQNPELVAKWKKTEYPRIRKEAKKVNAEIFFSDESGVRSDFHAGTTWAPRGKTPVIQHTGKRFSLNMISAVSPRGALRFMTSRKQISADLFLEFLRRLVRGAQRRIFLIVDGLAVHRAKKVKAFVESAEGWLKLFFLPHYAPEVNPDEQVWNDVKNNGVGRSMIQTPDDLKSAAKSRLLYLQKNPAHVRTFFQMTHNRYAA